MGDSPSSIDYYIDDGLDQPCDGDGGCEDPGHVADDYAAKQLGKGRW